MESGHDRRFQTQLYPHCCPPLTAKVNRQSHDSKRFGGAWGDCRRLLISGLLTAGTTPAFWVRINTSFAAGCFTESVLRARGSRTSSQTGRSDKKTIVSARKRRDIATPSVNLIDVSWVRCLNKTKRLYWPCLAAMSQERPSPPWPLVCKEYRYSLDYNNITRVRRRVRRF